uniref:Uncharacterized protein n=1 Tax=Anguilla anguilla TaxID=7936 RepID=A0A0E9VCR0_ANGAN
MTAKQGEQGLCDCMPL